MTGGVEDRLSRWLAAELVRQNGDAVLPQHQFSVRHSNAPRSVQVYLLRSVYEGHPIHYISWCLVVVMAVLLETHRSAASPAEQASETSSEWKLGCVVYGRRMA